ncbi:MAG TPA: response regulator transcription factor [Mycobacteriales bacterium]|nr:response regulator transcription factor [Mycobacteriales bacterium]
MLVVDDHAVFSELLTLALDDLDEFHCVGSAASVAEALAVAARERPGIVVVDLMLGDEDGLDVVRLLRGAYPDVVIVVVSAHSGAGTLASVAAAGANGFAPKSGAFSETVAVLRRARPGSVYVAPSLLAQAIPAPTAAGRPLTAREADVLSLMGHGASAREIARILNISVNTCRNYVAAVHRKLGATTQLEAVVTASRIGLIGPLGDR